MYLSRIGSRFATNTWTSCFGTKAAEHLKPSSAQRVTWTPPSQSRSSAAATVYSLNLAVPAAYWLHMNISRSTGSRCVAPRSRDLRSDPFTEMDWKILLENDAEGARSEDPAWSRRRHYLQQPRPRSSAPRSRPYERHPSRQPTVLRLRSCRRGWFSPATTPPRSTLSCDGSRAHDVCNFLRP